MRQIFPLLFITSCGFSQDLWTQQSAAMLRSLSENPNCHIWQAGRSAGGRPLWQILVIRPDLQPHHTLRVMIVGGLHGNEPVAAQQTLEILRSLASSPPAGVCYIFIPFANPDGLMAGRRVNGHNVDLNRDFGPFTQPESRAVAAVYAQWRPHLYLDLHDWGPDYPHSGSGLEAADPRAFGPLWPLFQQLGPGVTAAKVSSLQQLSHRYFTRQYWAPAALLENGRGSHTYLRETVGKLNSLLTGRASQLAASLNRRMNLMGWSSAALSSPSIATSDLAYPVDSAGTAVLGAGLLLILSGGGAWWRLRQPPVSQLELSRQEALRLQLLRLVREHNVPEGHKKHRRQRKDRAA